MGQGLPRFCEGAAGSRGAIWGPSPHAPPPRGNISQRQGTQTRLRPRRPPPHCCSPCRQLHRAVRPPGQRGAAPPGAAAATAAANHVLEWMYCPLGPDLNIPSAASRQDDKHDKRLVDLSHPAKSFL